MNRIAILNNPIQEYAWGSYTAIPDLTASTPNPAQRPQAELWMGAHPKAPSSIEMDGTRISLIELIDQFPIEILGLQTARAFHNHLPYLFKILAAANPLSIQAHPNREQAQRGFERENQQNRPLTAMNRNYKDDNHKPECICALSPFWALNGFRPISDIYHLLSQISSEALTSVLWSLKPDPKRNASESHRLKIFFEQLMTLEIDKVKQITHAAERLAESSPHDPILGWVQTLTRHYPGDIGILCPLILNLVCLKPGEAMYLPAGQLHAYLEGLGIELMANSDNVLRGGLTPKHVDVPELLEVLRFEATPIDILTPLPINRFERQYVTPAREFVLSTIALEAGQIYQSPLLRSVEILLCTQGVVHIDVGPDHSPASLRVKQGASVFIPASVPNYRIQGSGILFKAGVPISN